jgi:hypothetical protein
MTALLQSRHISAIRIPQSATEDDVNEIVYKAFDTLPDIASFELTMFKWRLLIRVKRGKGQCDTLLPYKMAPNVSHQDFKW